MDRPKDLVSLMEHGVVFQPSVLVSFGYTLLHKRGQGLVIDAKPCHNYQNCIFN